MGLFSSSPKMCTLKTNNGTIKYMKYVSDEHLPEDPEMLKNMTNAYRILTKGSNALPRKYYYHVAIKYYSLLTEPDNSADLQTQFDLGIELLAHTKKHSINYDGHNSYHGTDPYFFEDYSEKDKLEIGSRLCRQALMASLRQPEMLGELVNSFLICQSHIQLGVGLDEMLGVLLRINESNNLQRSALSRRIFNCFHSDLDIFYGRVMSGLMRSDLPDYLPELLRIAKISLKEYLEIARTETNHAALLLSFCEGWHPAEVRKILWTEGNILDHFMRPFIKKYGRLGNMHARALIKKAAAEGHEMYAPLKERVLALEQF